MPLWVEESQTERHSPGIHLSDDSNQARMEMNDGGAKGRRDRQCAAKSFA